ncbi:unnamed protein product [Cylicostephanus goldi]|uniref:Uncharacterized protein n=1 Tax=Cylicostephanus goldi TaxID=71465 RepID=A0A3P7M796_CYLGO|nr:unnamed protein product [Cylicostephanus goldi]
MSNAFIRFSRSKIPRLWKPTFLVGPKQITWTRMIKDDYLPIFHDQSRHAHMLSRHGMELC